jgi:hypothetical protein
MAGIQMVMHSLPLENREGCLELLISAIFNLIVL